MRDHKLCAGRCAPGNVLDRVNDPSAGLLHRSDSDRWLPLGEIVIHRSFGRSARFDKIVEAGRSIAALPKQPHSRIDDRLPMSCLARQILSPVQWIQHAEGGPDGQSRQPPHR